MAKRQRIRGKLRYPRHAIEPEDLMHFIEMRQFSEDWEALGMRDEDLAALQICIMAGWKKAPVVTGTGGLRKLRFGRRHAACGKQGGIRVGFTVFPDYYIVLLIVAYGKSEKDDLTPAERQAIKQLIARAEKEIVRLRSLH